MLHRLRDELPIDIGTKAQWEGTKREGTRNLINDLPMNETQCLFSNYFQTERFINQKSRRIYLTATSSHPPLADIVACLLSLDILSFEPDSQTFFDPHHQKALSNVSSG